MRKYLLPENGNFYKANLHCHSTVSDGRWTPEEIKEKYMAHGYSIVAYTDHSVFITHNDLRSEDFLPMNGYEMDFPCKQKDCHIGFISLDPNKKIQKIFYENCYLDKNVDKACLDENREYLVRKYSPEFLSDIMTQGAADGFFVTYNHPVWSLETKDEYCNYHGMHAMEIVNYNCIVGGYDDRNGNIYDEMLRNGEKLYCVATDDNHNIFPQDSPRFDSFGGFTMIKAERLEYDSIANALLNGDFYSSEGPEIKEIYFENNKIYIECSEAERIIMSAETRRYKVVTGEKVGETVHSACFDIFPKLGSYVRLTVVDKYGKMANTNAFFLSSLPLTVDEH